MKKILTILLMLVIGTVNVNAKETNCLDYYINKKGVVINKENYNILKESFTDDQIDYFNQDFYDKVKGHKWIFTPVQEIEIRTTTPFNSSPWPPESRHETDYKIIYVSLGSSSGVNYNVMNLRLVWKKMPKVRSYDVLAMRGKNLVFHENTGNVKVKYTMDGQTYTNSLDAGNSNIYTNTGTGLSFVIKLPTSTSITSMEMEMFGTAKITNTKNATIYGTYQHTQSNITLDQAKNHSFDENGLGGILKFANSTVQNSYDQMKGVYYTVAK